MVCLESLLLSFPFVPVFIGDIVLAIHSFLPFIFIPLVVPNCSYDFVETWNSVFSIPSLLFGDLLLLLHLRLPRLLHLHSLSFILTHSRIYSIIYLLTGGGCRLVVVPPTHYHCSMLLPTHTFYLLTPHTFTFDHCIICVVGGCDVICSLSFTFTLLLFVIYILNIVVITFIYIYLHIPTTHFVAPHSHVPLPRIHLSPFVMPLTFTLTRILFTSDGPLRGDGWWWWIRWSGIFLIPIFPTFYPFVFIHTGGRSLFLNFTLRYIPLYTIPTICPSFVPTFIPHSTLPCHLHLLSITTVIRLLHCPICCYLLLMLLRARQPRISSRISLCLGDFIYSTRTFTPRRSLCALYHDIYALYGWLRLGWTVQRLQLSSPFPYLPLLYHSHLLLRCCSLFVYYVVMPFILRLCLDVISRCWFLLHVTLHSRCSLCYDYDPVLVIPIPVVSVWIVQFRVVVRFYVVWCLPLVDSFDLPCLFVTLHLHCHVHPPHHLLRSGGDRLPLTVVVVCPPHYLTLPLSSFVVIIIVGCLVLFEQISFVVVGG